MRELDQLAKHDFDPLIGNVFSLALGAEQTLELELVSAEALASATLADATRMPFSLMFRSRGEQQHVSQRIHSVQHGKLGVLEIFLVPIGPDAEGMRYEAVFA